MCRFCKGENLYFRPKRKQTALMFLLQGKYFWSHVMNDEFEVIRKNK